MNNLNYILLFILVFSSFIFLNINFFSYNTQTSLNYQYEKLNYNYDWLNEKSFQKYNKSYYDLTEEEFYNFIVLYYVYKKGKLDCKYWTLFYNKIFTNLGYNTKYVLLENKHIFLVVWNNEKYITLDGLNFKVTKLG